PCVYSHLAHRDPHSFPTRRSSDLNGIIINKIKYIIYAPNDMIHPPTISSPIVNNSQINDESQRWRSFSCCFIALYFLQLTYVNTEIITVEIIIKMIVNGYNCPSYN